MRAVRCSHSWSVCCCSVSPYVPVHPSSSRLCNTTFIQQRHAASTGGRRRHAGDGAAADAQHTQHSTAAGACRPHGAAGVAHSGGAIPVVVVTASTLRTHARGAGAAAVMHACACCACGHGCSRGRAHGSSPDVCGELAGLTVTVGAQDVQVERAVGSVGFITMQSWPPRGATAEVEGAGQSLEAAERDRSQQMQPGSVQAKLYTGCVCARIAPRPQPRRLSPVQRVWPKPYCVVLG